MPNWDDPTSPLDIDSLNKAVNSDPELRNQMVRLGYIRRVFDEWHLTPKGKDEFLTRQRSRQQLAVRGLIDVPKEGAND